MKLSPVSLALMGLPAVMAAGSPISSTAISQSTSSASASVSMSMSASASASASASKKPTTAPIEYYGTFTIDGAVYAVTSESGKVAFDGKTLTVGGAGVLILGETITDAKKGLIVDQTLVQLTTRSASSSIAVVTSSSAVPASNSASPSGAAMTSSAAPSAMSNGGSGGGSGGMMASTSSMAGLAPRPTAGNGGANAAAVVGAVVGIMIL